MFIGMFQLGDDKSMSVATHTRAQQSIGVYKVFSAHFKFYFNADLLKFVPALRAVFYFSLSFQDSVLKNQKPNN